MNNDDFMLFIISHNRPHMITLNTLFKYGYTGNWCIVLDDTDSAIQDYIDKYGSEHILIFNKNYYINTCETGTNDPSYKCTVYVKNAIEEYVKKVGIKFFIIADDDIQSFNLRYIENDKLKNQKVTNIDTLIKLTLDYLQCSKISALSYCYASAYMCGIDAFSQERMCTYYRIPSVFIFRHSKYEFNWTFDYGEDIINGVSNNKVGNLVMSIPNIQVNSVVTTKRLSGGMTENYKRDMTKLAMRYVVSNPDCLGIIFYNGRFVAKTNRKCAFPKIISSNYRKEKYNEKTI